MFSVIKRSKKPFKSGLIIERAYGTVTNPYSNKVAYLLEDGSYVDVYQCRVIDDHS